MAIRILSGMLTGLAGQGPVSVRGDQVVGVRQQDTATPFVETATVFSVAASSATVSFKGQYIVALLATDEPLQAGQEVYITKTDSGEFVVLGSVK